MGLNLEEAEGLGSMDQ